MKEDGAVGSFCNLSQLGRWKNGGEEVAFVRFHKASCITGGWCVLMATMAHGGLIWRREARIYARIVGELGVARGW